MFVRLLVIVFIPLLITSITSIFVVKSVSERALEAHFLEITRSKNMLIGKIISEYPEPFLRSRMMLRRSPLKDDFRIFIYDREGKLAYGDINSPEYKILGDKLDELSNLTTRKILKIKGLYVDVMPIKSPSSNFKTLIIVFKYKNLEEFENIVLKDFPLILAFLIILSVFIAIFMSYIFYSKFNNSLKNLMNFTREIGNGNYNAGILGPVFTAELAEFSQALKILQSKLREQERVRKKISSEVSHELRTPISIIRSQLEAIHDGILPPDKDRIENLIKQIDKLSDLVTKVRNLTELIATELKFEPVNLKVILQETCESMRNLFREKGIDLVCDDMNMKEIWINGNREKLTIAVRNVLDNSLKYTQKGTVKVSILEEEGKAIISINDTGIGISKDDLPYITERFYRANTGVEGSGLGLALVKEIVELHGGKLEIESELGKGTTVKLIFKKIRGGYDE